MSGLHYERLSFTKNSTTTSHFHPIMWKRQRSSSPLPFSSSNALLGETSTPMGHDAKRRRIQPPVLDGQMRGWGTSQDIYGTHRDKEDDGEEDIFDEADASQASVSPNGGDSNSPYKSANDFLYELHALHRHRHLISANTTIPRLSSGYLGHDPLHQHRPHEQPRSPSTSISSSFNTPYFKETNILAVDTRDTNLENQHESASVRCYYEEGNKYLKSGSLFPYKF
ncbi:hypothetical protein C8R42DRAFT_637020 [Lentinula raphanica]|nr:hypothetical protein C8R42DRAFT_637020 [Lentinula raphanica]